MTGLPSVRGTARALPGGPWPSHRHALEQPGPHQPGSAPAHTHRAGAKGADGGSARRPTRPASARRRRSAPAGRGPGARRDRSPCGACRGIARLIASGVGPEPHRGPSGPRRRVALRPARSPRAHRDHRRHTARRRSPGSAHDAATGKRPVGLRLALARRPKRAFQPILVARMGPTRGNGRKPRRHRHRALRIRPRRPPHRLSAFGPAARDETPGRGQPWASLARTAGS